MSHKTLKFWSDVRRHAPPHVLLYKPTATTPLPGGTKCLFGLQRHGTKCNTIHPWTQLTHHPKRNPDPISRFPQYTRQTGRQTERWYRRQSLYQQTLMLFRPNDSDAARKLVYFLKVLAHYLAKQCCTYYQ